MSNLDGFIGAMGAVAVGTELYVLIVFGLVYLLIVGAGFLAWRLLKRRRAWRRDTAPITYLTG